MNEDEIAKLEKAAHQEMMNGNLDYALTCINQLIAQSSEKVNCWHTKGLILEELKRFPEAIEAYRRAHQLNPNWQKPILSLGLIYYDLNEFALARDYLKKSIAIKPGVVALTILSNLELNTTPEKALQYAEMALELEPNWDEALHLRDEARQKIKNRT
jgi:tetratricopeptide (TPR) repeat protein